MCKIIVYHFVYNKTFSICDGFSELEAPHLDGLIGIWLWGLCEYKLISLLPSEEEYATVQYKRITVTSGHTEIKDTSLGDHGHNYFIQAI